MERHATVTEDEADGGGGAGGGAGGSSGTLYGNRCRVVVLGPLHVVDRKNTLTSISIFICWCTSCLTHF